MIARAPGKVNTVLYVGRPRPDGYHPLASVVQPLSLADEVCLEPGLTTDAVVCEGVEGDNLALRALTAYREATGWDAPAQRITIDKRVPVAAGMGGGSADAAATLRLAAAAHGAAVPDGLAAQLGADVPALLTGGRVLMTGIGEHVERLPDPDPAGFVVVAAAHGLSTPAVYAEFDRLGLGREAAELDALADELRGGRHPPHNDLEPAAISLLPELERTLERVRAAGCDHALVSGSGPTVVGVWDDPDAARAAAADLGGVFAEPVGPDFGAPA